MGDIGSWLIRAREARGLTLEDAERDTRISRRYLQALESEQFDVIPAPVYARGFLRSYSQYLGLDPQEVLALFPRDDEPAYQTAPPTAPGHRPSAQQPISAVGASRPTWRRPQQPQSAQAQRTARQAEMPFEPMIGVDIGVPNPTRRIKPDPAAQVRSLAVLAVAVGAVAFVLLIALLLSKLGGSDDSPGTSPRLGQTTAPSLATATLAAGASGLNVTPGVVPAVEGEDVIIARKAIGEAGFEVVEKRQAGGSQPKGKVIQQSPGPGVAKSAGVSSVTIIVSDGP